jgi:uncharacterized protein with FMN-binding domain
MKAIHSFVRVVFVREVSVVRGYSKLRIAEPMRGMLRRGAAGLLLTALLLAGCALDGGGLDNGGGLEDDARYKSGEYTASAESVGGPLWVAVSFTANAIGSVAVTSHNDTIDRPEVARALDAIPQAIVAAQSPEVDVVTMATITSRRIMDAVKDCIAQAKIERENGTDTDVATVLETMTGVWYSHYGGVRLDGYRVGKWKDRHELLPQAKRDLFPGFDIDAPQFRNYNGMAYNAANDYGEDLDEAYFVFYDDTVYGEDDNGEGGNGGWGEFHSRYIGIVKAVNTFAVPAGGGNAGAVIIQYLDKCYPTWDSDFAGVPPMSFFGVYYRILNRDLILMANAVDLDRLNAGEKYYTETATLQEALTKNTAENESKFVAGVAISQERDR